MGLETPSPNGGMSNERMDEGVLTRLKARKAAMAEVTGGKGVDDEFMSPDSCSDSSPNRQTTPATTKKLGPEEAMRQINRQRAAERNRLRDEAREIKRRQTGKQSTSRAAVTKEVLKKFLPEIQAKVPALGEEIASQHLLSSTSSSESGEEQTIRQSAPTPQTNPVTHGDLYWDGDVTRFTTSFIDGLGQGRILGGCDDKLELVLGVAKGLAVGRNANILSGGPIPPNIKADYGAAEDQASAANMGKDKKQRVPVIHTLAERQGAMRVEKKNVSGQVCQGQPLP